jgi:hypothetical protein
MFKRFKFIYYYLCLLKKLYLSEPKIQIDGQPASPELMKDLLQITVEEACILPAMFTVSYT